MTRINCVPVTELHDKHLLAEYRELPRLFNAIKKWQERGEPGDVPTAYVLGRGHVRFFYRRAMYLYKRQRRIYDECVRRGFKVKYNPDPRLIDGIHMHNMQDWVPTRTAQRLNRQRIKDRMPT